MIERQIPKEIGDKEISVIGKFSLRQFGLIMAGLGISIVAFLLLPDVIRLDYKFVIAGVFSVPFFICVFFEKYKMHANTYFYKLYFDKIRNVKFRCYKRYNQYEKLERSYNNKHKTKSKKQKSKVKYKVVKIR